MGEGSNKVLASGGEDGTVRLWSLSSSGGRGQRALKATLYGHEKPVNIMSIAGYELIYFGIHCYYAFLSLVLCQTSELWGLMLVS